MDGDVATVPRLPGEENGIDVEAVNVQIESEELGDDASPDPNTDDPPEYDTVLAEEDGHPVSETDGDGGAPPPTPPPLSYEAVMSENSERQQTTSNTLTTEAPPSYLQLFGGKEETDGWRRLRLRLGGGREGGGGGGRNRHLRFQNLLPTDQNSAYKCGIVLALLILLWITGMAMIVIGFVYYNKCAVHEVPLYLIVAGLFFLVEVILHSLLWTAQKLSSDETIYRLIRRFDFIALFLIVWLVVGSAWIFKAGRENSCRDFVDYVIPGNYSSYLEEEETWSTRGSSVAGDCGDCPPGVYVFTVFLILFQYIMVLVLGICCCTSAVRSRRYH